MNIFPISFEFFQSPFSCLFPLPSFSLIHLPRGQTQKPKPSFFCLNLVHGGFLFLFLLRFYRLSLSLESVRISLFFFWIFFFDMSEGGEKRRKMAPLRPLTLHRKAKEEIYVSFRANEIVLLKKMKKIFDRDEVSHLMLHGLGGTISIFIFPILSDDVLKRP